MWRVQGAADGGTRCHIARFNGTADVLSTARALPAPRSRVHAIMIDMAHYLTVRSLYSLGDSHIFSSKKTSLNFLFPQPYQSSIVSHRFFDLLGGRRGVVLTTHTHVHCHTGRHTSYIWFDPAGPPEPEHLKLLTLYEVTNL